MITIISSFVVDNLRITNNYNNPSNKVVTNKRSKLYLHFTYMLRLIAFLLENSEIEK